MKKDYQYWMDRLQEEAEASEDWRDKAKKINERYRIEEVPQDGEFNILWSNTEVMHSVLFSNVPKANVARRFKDKNPAARVGSEILERALEYSIDQYDFVGLVDGAVNNYLLPGVATIRIRYKPYYENQDPVEKEVEVHESMNDDGSPGQSRYFLNGQELSESEIDINDSEKYIYTENPEPVVAYEEVICESVEWDRLRWDRSVKSWDRINWACIDYVLDRDELIDQFGTTKGNAVKLTESRTIGGKTEDLALIHEIFDLKERKTIVISDGLKDEFLAEWEDPLGLRDYLPFPKPLFANLSSDKIEPTPEFLYYQEQAIELNTISNRITVLVDALKVRGAYDDTFPELANIAVADDNTMVPVNKLTQRLNGGKIDDVLKFMPITEIVGALMQLYRQREEIKQIIYEVTGISDILRGSTKASETLGAQEIKKGFAELRIARKQTKVQEFIRDIFRIKAEIIAEHFSDETLSLMTGMEITPEVMELIRSDVLRSYNITIETDSTIRQDQAQEKKDRIEAVKAIAGMVKEYMPAIQAGVLPKEMFKEVLLFALRAFKGGRTLEDMIEQMDMQQQPPQQPPQQQGRPMPQQGRPQRPQQNVRPIQGAR